MELAERQADGEPLRAHLSAVAARGGPIDDRLLSEIPRNCAFLWSAFLSLSMSRRSGMSVHALALVDVEAWCRLNGVRLNPWELEILMALDGLSIRKTAERFKRETGAKK